MASRTSEPRATPAQAQQAQMPAEPGAYEAARPYVVIEELDELAGPATGVVELPVTLDWGPRPIYDLSDPARRQRFYTVVIREAQKPDDLRRHLNRDLLIELWPGLVLPERCTAAWNAQFPQLEALGTGRGRR